MLDRSYIIKPRILTTVSAQPLAGGVFKRLLPKARVFSRALYTFDIGQNDLTAGYFLNMTTDEVRAYIPDVLGQFKTYVKVTYIDFFNSYFFPRHNKHIKFKI